MTVARTPHLRRFGLALVLASLLAIGFATLLPEPPAKTGSHLCLACGSLGVVNAVLNVFLFLPFGVGLALSGMSWKHALATACALSTAIELTQFLAIAGRYSTVGDVITNTLGGAIGFALGRYIHSLFRPTPRFAQRLCVVWAAVWLIIQVVSNYGFTMSLPTSQYYGQLARKLGSFDVFRGQVLSANVGTLPIPNTSLRESRRVRLALLSGTTVGASVLPASPTAWVAPILRVADDRNREIALIAQKGADMVFGIHTGASVLKLRAPLFILDRAFPTRANGSADDTATVLLSGTYQPDEVTLEAQTPGGRRVARLPIAASLGWTFWLPFQWFIGGSRQESVWSFIWLACLSLPLGYWGFGRLIASVQENTVVRIPVFGGVVVIVGFVLVPLVYGTAPASLASWGATFVGGGLGAALAAWAGSFAGTGYQT